MLFNPESSLVLSLCLITFMTMSSFSMKAPFYPLKARALGVNILYVGQIMGAMAIISMISSFFTGKIMHKNSSKKKGKVQVILAAIVLLIIQNLLLGSLEFM